MPRTAPLIFKVLLILSLTVSNVSCSLFDGLAPTGAPLLQKNSRQRIFFANFDTMWRVAHTVLKYTIANENTDTGIIETEYIKGVDGWLAPDQKKAPSAGLRYKLTLTLSKGKTDGRESTRVTIEKRIEVLKDFFSEPQILETDGLEEAALFYRMERELIVSEALKKAN